MAPRLKQNIVGTWYNDLKVIANLGSREVIGHTQVGAASSYECRCGESVVTLDSLVRTGRKKTCGLCPKDYTGRVERKGVWDITNPGEGFKKDSEPGWYRSYTAMKRRCFNPNTINYKNYGGRGITVCARWVESAYSFFLDMGNRPEGHTIDRVDVNGNYEPDNCRWATSLEQSQNKRIHATSE